MNNSDNLIWDLLINKLIFEREEQLKDRLKNLEQELSSQNRFFPQSKILEQIDGLVEIAECNLPKGTIVYRARTIDKYHENAFFDRFFREMISKVKRKIPEFGEKMNSDDIIKLQAYTQRNGTESVFSEEEWKEIFSKFGKKSFWGYNKKESDAPPINSVSVGRINPKGICYLYISSDERTAALEVRPTISQYVSIAEIEIRKSVRLFDLSKYDEKYDTQDNIDRMVDWKVFSDYFSQPNYSGELAYLATQYISEYIKNIKDQSGNYKFDGICFKSSLNPDGVNYVLFDTSPERRKYKVSCSGVYQVLDLWGNLQKQLPLEESMLETSNIGIFH